MGEDAVRMALLREEGHRQRLPSHTSSAALARIRSLWMDVLHSRAILEDIRRSKVAPLNALKIGGRR